MDKPSKWHYTKDNTAVIWTNLVSDILKVFETYTYFESGEHGASFCDKYKS